MPTADKVVRNCAISTHKLLKSWAWQSLPLDNLELPHYCLAINFATISRKLQTDFREFYFQLCKHKPIYVLATQECEDGAQACHYVVHYMCVCCFVQTRMLWANACGEQGWGYLLSWLHLHITLICTYTAVTITQARKETVQEITKWHLVYREGNSVQI